MRIDPKLIIEFAAIAKEKSFTRAAQRLQVAQPWLSARLHKLEEILGFRLFDRTTRNVALTERGAEFFEAACRVAEASECADRLALQLRRRNQRLLRIGAPPYTKIIRQRRDLIDRFALSHPHIRLELETGWSDALMARLSAGEIDLAFIIGSHWAPQYERLVLGHLGLGMTVSRESPLARAQVLTPEDVAGYTIEVFTRSLNKELWDELYAPLLAVNARLVEMPEIAEGPPSEMRSPDQIAAFFDFGEDDKGTPQIVRIPMATSVAMPFQLARRAGHPSPEASELWDMALSQSHP